MERNQPPTRPADGHVVRSLTHVAATTGSISSGAVCVLGDRELGASMERLDAVRRDVERLTLAVVAEAARRGTATTDGASSLGDWVRLHAPAMATTEVASLVTVVRAAASPRNRPLAEAALAGDVPVRRAARLVHALDQIHRFVTEDEYGDYQRLVLPLAHAATGSDKETTQACASLVAAVRPEPDSEDLAARQRQARDFFEHATAAGMTDFTWRLDPEGAAFVRAVTTSLAAKPCPDATGPDLRSAGHRKADALLSVLKRGMAAPDSIHTNGAVKMVVTTSLSNLTGGDGNDAGVLKGAGAFGDARATGRSGTGEQLTPGQLRRLACEAEVVPAVFGTASELLDLGRSSRLATAAQHLALSLRDKGCTIPGCSMPPQWCIAHHLRWWSRGGPTDLDNLALVCERHHSAVHQSDRHGSATPRGVSWDP